MHDVREHRPESLALAALDLVDADMARVFPRAQSPLPNPSRYFRKGELMPNIHLAEIDHREIDRRRRGDIASSLLGGTAS